MSRMESTLELETQELAPEPSFRLLRRLSRRPVAVVAICLIVALYTAGILAPWIAPYDFDTIDLNSRYAGSSSEHLLGADELGRDSLSRIIWSMQTTVIISIAVMVTGGLVLGVGLGLLAGYAGGWVDGLIMRVGEVLISIPTLLLLLIIIGTMQDRVDNWFRGIEDFTGIDGLARYFLLGAALSIFSWVGMARLIRSQTLALRETAYIVAARGAGASTFRILYHHLLPNVTNIIIVVVTASLGAAAAAEIGLSFLGLGIELPHPSFGIMISDYAQDPSNIRDHPTLIIYPLVVIATLILSFNLLGDVLTDVMSPRRR
jgi:ABC-type dipeptide/oligopeptide/nickel transport system permease subunit